MLAQHFEDSHLPARLPHYLPDDWRGGLALLGLVFVLSSFLDNIAAAMIGGTVAATVFRNRLHIGYLAAIASAVFPAGLGVKDAAFAWSVKVALPSESFAVGAALAIAVRAVQTVAELGYIGLVSLITKPLKESKEESASKAPPAEPDRVSPG